MSRCVRPWASIALVLLGGCVVDVDLGGPPADQAPLDAERPPTPDAVPLDAATVPDALPIPDRDAAEVDAGPVIDAAPQPDAGPEFIETCAECIDLLAVSVACGDELPCDVEPSLIDACAFLCEAPDDGSCEGCFDALVPLLDACADHAPAGACDALQVALLDRCDERCSAGGCSACLEDVFPICLPEAPFECGDGLADDFARCFGECDGPLIFDGMACAIDAADAWALCTYTAPEPCDGLLGVEVELCRLLAASAGIGCFESCTALGGIRAEMCLNLGADVPSCEARAAAHDEGCLALCQGAPWGRCGPAAWARQALCDAAGGVACDALSQTMAITCSAGAFGHAPCEACLLEGLSAYDACGGTSECLDVLEGEWSACLGQCDLLGPEPGCLQCALDADDRMGRCMLDGTDPVTCLAQRDRAAVCAPLCGDALPRAVPCTLRTQALWDACLAEPEDPMCFEAGALFDAACHWARLGVE